MLDFRIKTFIAVWEERSYTKAAGKMFITQPAVSQHIKHLEARLGAALFRFIGRELSLTEAGAALYRYASLAAAEGRKTEALIASLGTAIPICFGATRTIGEYVLPPFLAGYLRENPDADISMVVDNTDVLLGRLKEGTIDFAFIEGIFDREEYATKLFIRDSFIPVCSARNPLASGEVGFDDILGRRLIVREKGSGSRMILENALAGFNLKIARFHRVLELGNLEVIKDFVAEDLGIAFLYERSVRRELDSGRLAAIRLRNFSVSHDYSFVYLKNSVYEDTYNGFLAALAGNTGAAADI